MPGRTGVIDPQAGLDAVHRYDPVSDSWEDRRPLPHRRSHCEPGTFVHEGRIYCAGENDMSFHPFRKDAAKRLGTTISTLRADLGEPALPWFISQQPPTDHDSVNSVDVVADLAAMAARDPHTHHRLVTDLPPQPKQLVFDTAGIVEMGRRWADSVIEIEQE